MEALTPPLSSCRINTKSKHHAKHGDSGRTPNRRWPDESNDENTPLAARHLVSAMEEEEASVILCELKTLKQVRSLSCQPASGAWRMKTGLSGRA